VALSKTCGENTADAAINPVFFKKSLLFFMLTLFLIEIKF
jgi:hypothetical protein